MKFVSGVDDLAETLLALGVKRLCTDSRQIQAGDAFIAWPGYGQDARKYVAQAFNQGAIAAVVEAEGIAAWGWSDAHVYAVPELKQQAGRLASCFYSHPSAALKVCAITGTNGKTSSAWWLAQAIENLHKRAIHLGLGHAGVIGTLGVGRVTDLQPTGLTTPDPVVLQQSLREMVDAGCGVCAVEASSIGLQESRMNGVVIHTAALTNFSQDHLDYHGSMEAYWKAKEALFRWQHLHAAVLNLDDDRAVTAQAVCTKADVSVLTYGLHASADLVAQNVRMEKDGCAAHVLYKGQAEKVYWAIYGDYNISNMLGVVAILLTLGVSLSDACAATADLPPVPGRMEAVIESGYPTVLVDYAHTPDALQKALQALRAVANDNNAQLWCVFGCGGDRDSSKRPLMGQVAAANADYCVVTSDNPRMEDPETIIAQIVSGMPQGATYIHTNRADAIRWAVRSAQPQDIVLVAGKGHEEYQEIRGIKYPYSDQLVVRALFADKKERHV